jgi:hypothetical protein
MLIKFLLFILSTISKKKKDLIKDFSFILISL